MNQTAKNPSTAGTTAIKPGSLNPKKTANKLHRNAFQNKHWIEIFRRAVEAQQQINLPSLHL